MTALGSTVGEAFAIAPDTFVVPGWWSFPGSGLGIPLGTLVVRGESTAVIDTAPAPLEDDWLAAVLALVDLAEVRWIVATAADPVRAGCVGALHALAPQATVVVPGGGVGVIDLGPGAVIDLHEVPPGPEPDVGPCPVPDQIVASVPDRRVLWTDLVGGAFTRPARDVATLGDDDLLAAIARRHRPLRPGELVRTATLGLRVLGSPIGPIARGPSIGRVLDLARRAEELRSPTTLSLDALVAPLGPPPTIDASPTIDPAPPIGPAILT